MRQAEAKNYWESRFASDVSLSTTGWLGLGPAFNAWMYRVRRFHFMRMVAAHRQHIHKVLDVGSGSGFYLDLWRACDVDEIVGTDLTDAAVAKLRSEGRQNVQQFDATSVVPSAWRGYFDAVSAMDMLYHILEDEEYERAIANVASMLRPGGLLIFSENMLHDRSKIEAGHQVCRTLAHTTEVLKRSGFEVVERRPVFFLMNTPVDSTSGFLKTSWRVVSKVARTHDALGFLMGSALFPLEIATTTALKEGPSTELVLCRKAHP